MEPPSIRLNDVWVEYAIYGMGNRSLKKTMVHLASAGRLAQDGGGLSRVQALKGINLEIRDGDRIGLVGGNGAGKTTLLRVLSGGMRPVRGTMRRVGRTASLFDVSLGINPEATGWDNIVLRGLFLGLSRAEIRARTGDIVDFSGLAPEQLARPVRTYSSGMLLRLAFAVSTSFHPDILLMDEWIGVGDAQFLEKAQTRLTSMAENARILVIASHVDAFIRGLCTKAIHMEEGRIVDIGPVDEVLAHYQAKGAAAEAERRLAPPVAV